jgi:hypothetical protein
MAADTIRRLFFTPPVAIARLGASTTPMEAFDWVVGDPHTIAETRVRPTWTLDVDAQGAVIPRMPDKLTVRDGPLQRPVAPFLELWAMVGDGPPSQWRPRPVTPELLAANNTGEAQLSFRVSALNRKASRRTGNAALRFGTFPPVDVRADDHRRVELRGESPPDAARRMIPAGRFIPLGQVQVLRSRAQPTNQPWSRVVRVDVVRLRVTPGRGRVFGPPAAVTARPPAVTSDRAFLDPDAGWFGAARGNRVVPADTVDERAAGGSLGVVDDTCDVTVDARLAVGTSTLRAHANVSVGPPHFAPDRRPFLSLADELNDRQHDPARDASMSAAARSAWVEDLFERIYETVALFDVDFWRSARARELAANELRPMIPGDGVPDPTRAMGGRDRLRDPEIAVPGRSDIEPLPLSARARERHRTLSDLSELVPWLLSHPGRLQQLVRPPFASSARDNANETSMQMPPFMRHSNALPLTLATWQYDLLMEWATALATPAAPGPTPGPAGLSPTAAGRRRQVLDLLEAQDGPA